MTTVPKGRAGLFGGLVGVVSYKRNLSEVTLDEAVEVPRNRGWDSSAAGLETVKRHLGELFQREELCSAAVDR